MPDKRVAIVGGGITGLTAAYYLERCSDVDIDLYEASDRVGGKIGTTMRDSFLVESGPDCFFSRKPAALELVKELGLESQLIVPQARHFSLLHKGRLYEVPRELVSLVGITDQAIWAAEFLSEEGKWKASLESSRPAGSGQDESIHSFFTRRFGAEFSELVAEPLLAGTHAGDPAKLSMKALYPNYLAAEKTFKSLSAMSVKASTDPVFMSFSGGMETLISRLTGCLNRTQVHMQWPVQSPAAIEADQVILAVPSNIAASILQESTPDAAAMLADMNFASSTILTLALRGAQISTESTGFLVPPCEQDVVAGATWSSTKWPGRAPEGLDLVRVFLRNTRGLSETDLVAQATELVRPLIGWDGTPLFSQVTRWQNALPQYEVGHLDRLAEIERELAKIGNVHLAGTSYRGVGIPDCILQGRNVAERISKELAA